MAHYKAYFIGDDGRFVKGVDIIKDDDPAAIIAARALIGKHAIELWEHDRRIVQFDVFAGTSANAGLESQESN